MNTWMEWGDLEVKWGNEHGYSGRWLHVRDGVKTATVLSTCERFTLNGRAVREGKGDWGKAKALRRLLKW